MAPCNELEEEKDDKSMERTKRTKHLLHSKPEALYRRKRIHPARPGAGLQVSEGLHEGVKVRITLQHLRHFLQAACSAKLGRLLTQLCRHGDGAA